MWGSRPTRRWSVLVTFAVAAVLVLPAHAREKPASGDGSTDIEARLELGRLYHEQVFQSLDRAIAEYEAVAKAQPDLAEARYYLALAYHTKGKLNADDAGLYRRRWWSTERISGLPPGGSWYRPRARTSPPSKPG